MPSSVALDPIGPLRDVVTSERQPQPLGERSEYRDDERRRRAESRAGRCVHERVEREAAFDRAELRHDMVVYSLVQVEHPVDRQLGLQLVAQRLVAVQSPQHDLRLVRRLDRGMGVQRDRRVENGSSVQVRVGTNVRSPSGQTDSKRGFASVNHGYAFGPGDGPGGRPSRAASVAGGIKIAIAPGFSNPPGSPLLCPEDDALPERTVRARRERDASRHEWGRTSLLCGKVSRIEIEICCNA